MAVPPGPPGSGPWGVQPLGNLRYAYDLDRLHSSVVFDDSRIVSEQHYHHGDHHHHHHQRHLHHFHDLHLVNSATETLDLRHTPQVDTRVIPGAAPIEMKLRPDLLGRMVFENGAQEYGFGMTYRIDGLPPPSELRRLSL
eukprot:NODE_584_length_725_cov_76.205686_g575_i0.p1 GENE.NODE_584_length_725_cov_76.205686_g575_i0~~NODE_584_length_725_cov_76.205686_g575_i0.p1  ORF type:complete len:163 (-),score=52.42 NODE_584_length_725_cov_76.205686_g575_i0:237-656(-)